jgi:hypothetical protein
MADFFRETESSGARNPPNRRPPTALALSTPPAPLPTHRRVALRRRSLLDRVRATVLVFMDAADDLADMVTRRIKTP